MEFLFVLHTDNTDEKLQRQIADLTHITPISLFCFITINMQQFSVTLYGLLIQRMKGITTSRT